MNVLVFVKRVPDTESRIRIDRAAKSVVEEGLNFIISPYDEYAIEEALRLREAKGGKVVVASLGPEEALATLRKALAMGADEAVLIKDDRKETYDPLRVARVLASFARARQADADLILFGRMSVGSDNASVSSMVAEILGLPQANVVTKLEIDGATAAAWREIESALEKISFSLPAVVSAQKGLNEPRYETLKGIMAAKKKTIPVLTLADLGLPEEASVPQVEVMNIELPAAKQAGKILAGTPEEAARELVRLLRTEAKAL
jgi:electron transfer flavoprotein beta subunit